MVRPRDPSYYQERSHHFLNRVDDELDRDEIELACELLWGAAAHSIKRAAELRGWEHGSHSSLRDTIEQLTLRGAPPHLIGQYGMMSAFHIGFYGDRRFRSGNLRLAKALIAEFIQTLESLPPAQTAP